MSKITKNKKKAGFTLIELLVVIAIIGLLSSIVLGSLKSAREKAQEAKTLQQLRQIRIAFELFASSNGGRYPLVPPGQVYCIGGTDCKFSGVSQPNKLAGILINGATTPQAIDINGFENKGFVYYYDTAANLTCTTTCPAGAAKIFAPKTSSSFILMDVGNAWDIEY